MVPGSPISGERGVGRNCHTRQHSLADCALRRPNLAV